MARLILPEAPQHAPAVAVERWSLGVLIAAALSSHGCGEHTEPFRTSALPVIDGTPSTGDPEVVAVTSAGLPHCTGTLLTPLVVLTAAHCVDAADLEVLFGQDVASPSARRLVVDTRVHANAGGIEPTDLALLRLESDAPADVAPATTWQSEELDAGVGRVVGFGRTNDFSLGKKQQGAVAIEAVEATTVVVAGGPARPCGGDSGGPIYVAAKGGEQLVAVISGGDAACQETSIATRIDPYLTSFVDPYLKSILETQVRAEVGALCEEDDDCATDLCVAHGDGASRCRERCVVGGSACGGRLECTAPSSATPWGACLPRDAPTSDANCSLTSPPSPSDGRWLACGLSLLGLLATRRRGIRRIRCRGSIGSGRISHS